MTCIRMGPSLGHAILCYQPEYRLKDASGKVWIFEFHKYCGPSVLGKRGELLRRQPGERSPFWDPFQKWFDQGQRHKIENGVAWAVWDETPGGTA